LDEGIVDTFVLGDVFGGRPVIRSDSSSQYTAERWAWSGPSNSFSALMNAQKSSSAIRVCFLRIKFGAGELK